MKASREKPSLRISPLSRLADMLLGRGVNYARTLPVQQRRRSVAIRVVDCGSSNAAELEIAALFNPVYDIERYGFHLTASPRHADLLLVSGPLTRNMESALLAAYWAMPEPRRLVTVGDGFQPAGLFAGSYAVTPLPDELLPGWIAHIPGDPPSPLHVLQVLCALEWN